MKIKTAIDESKLERWCQELPQCEAFLSGFFETCRPYDYMVNLVNYERDVCLYAKTEGWPDDCQRKLLQAFYNIAVDVKSLSQAAQA